MALQNKAVKAWAKALNFGMLLPLQGAYSLTDANPGRCPGLLACCPVGALHCWPSTDFRNINYNDI